MDDWKSCDNCISDSKDVCMVLYDPCPWWYPIPCPHCGGALSITREHNGHKYRHYYSCHMEFYEDVK